MISKVKSLEEIVEIIKELKKQGKTIVTTNGAFDLIHVGHVRNLEFCKKQGDVLIVGLNSDSSIKQYKSEKRPIIPQDQRAEVISGLESVDYIFIFNETFPIPFLEKIKPDVHVKGSEYVRKLPETEIVEKNGGKIVFRPIPKDEPCTTKIIKKITETSGDNKWMLLMILKKRKF